jgi:phospholipase C
LRRIVLYAAAACVMLAACAGGGSPTRPVPSRQLLGVHPDADVILNGGFENGMSPWTLVGSGRGSAQIVSGVAHSGTYSAFMGTTAQPSVNGLHGVAQSVVIPTGGVLMFWYQGGSNDTPQYADQEADLTDSVGRLVYRCWKGLVNTTTWTQQSCDVSAFAGRTLNVTFGVNDNGYASAYVYLYVDDVSLSGSAPTPSPTPSGSPSPTPTPGGAQIQHVVVMIQENRSVDNLFMGYPSADTVTTGLDRFGRSVPLWPVSLAAGMNPGHGLGAFLTDWDNGLMDGWTDSQIAYVPRSEAKPYWDIAAQNVLADRMFPSNIDSSFASHQYFIAAQAQRSVNNTAGGWWGCDGAPSDSVAVLSTSSRTIAGAQYPCFDYATLGDELDHAGISWRFYAPHLRGSGGYGTSGGSIWSAYQAVRHVRFGADWSRNVISPETQILSDVAAGTLAAVTWVVPSWTNSDHAGSGSATGPSWVASVVDAIGAQPNLWNHTAIFIVWDDWGGWYDHVPPPYLDNEGAGIRVPMLIVSPLAKRGYVSHVQYESTSVLKFIEDLFGLSALTQSDARAADPMADCFNPSGQAKPFHPIRAPYPETYFLRAATSERPPDEN